MALSTRPAVSLETDDCLLDGYLEKKSSILKAFKKRWMILKKNKHLYSYESKDNLTKPTEIFDLSVFNNVSVPINSKQNEWTFQIGPLNNNKKIRTLKEF